MKKRIVALLLTFVLVLGLIPVMGENIETSAGKLHNGKSANQAIEIDSSAEGNPYDKLIAYMAGSIANNTEESDSKPTYYKLVSDFILDEEANGYVSAPILIPEGRNIVLDLNGHTIDRNLTGEQDEGYVFCVKGSLTITDSNKDRTGLITGGYNSNEGGGFYICGDGSLTMSGGIISGNYATEGAGVYLAAGEHDNTSLSVYGDIIIRNNFSDNYDKNENNVYLPAGKKINVLYPDDNNPGLDPASSIGITMESAEEGSGSLEFANSDDSCTYVLECFKSDNRKFYPYMDSDGKYTLIDITDNEIWTEVIDVSALEAELDAPDYVGTKFIKLNSDEGFFEVDETLAVDIKRCILDLNGQDILLSDDFDTNNNCTLFGVGSTENYTNFIIIDNSSDHEGYIFGNGYDCSCVTIDEGIFSFDGGEISGFQTEDGAVITVNDSNVFIMNGGSICNNTVTDSINCGCIYVGGTFNLFDGEIYSNTVDGDEAGLLYLEGIFNMFGGDVYENFLESTDWVGIVYVNNPNGIFNMYGGYIEDNDLADGDSYTDSDYGCVVFTNNGFYLNGGIIFGNNGLGVYVNGKTFEMSRGLIDDNFGGVFIDEDALFTMNGGYISNNQCEKGAGVYIADGATFEMMGGKISGNEASDCGAGVYIEDFGKFYMNDGKIFYNHSKSDGGGIYMENGEFTMNGGSIYENSSESDGGGIYVDEGCFIVNDGSIYKNDALNGGGIYINDGKVEINDGEISDNVALQDENDAEGYGGGIYYHCGELYIKGGSITGNAADSCGGGIYSEETFIYLSGDPVIYDNNSGESDPDNTFFEEGCLFYVEDDLSNTAKIGVRMLESGTVTCNFNKKGSLENFSSDDSDFVLGISSGHEAVLHKHSFKAVAVSGSAITFECEKTDDFCDLGDDKQYVLNLSAPQGTLIYDGTDKTASVSGDTTVLSESTLGKYDIKYEKDGTAISTNPREPGNYTASLTYDDFTATISFTIDKKEINISGLIAKDKDYDETDTAFVDVTGAIFEGMVDGDVLEVTAKGKFDNAVSGKDKTVTLSEVTLDGRDKANYTLDDAWNDIKLKAEIRKIDSSFIQPVKAITGLEYTGENHKLITPGKVEGGYLEYACVKSGDAEPVSGYSTTVPEAKNAGNYTVYYRIVNDENHNGIASGSIDVNIASKSVENPVIEVIVPDNKGFVYKGERYEPSVNVYDGKNLIDPKEYTVSYSGNNNAGTATVTIADSLYGDYAVSGKTDFVISPKPVKISGITAKDKEFDEKDEATLVYKDVVFDGIIGEDKLTVTAVGKFIDANIGENKTVYISNITLGGEDASNYVLSEVGNQETAAAAIKSKQKNAEEQTNTSTNTSTNTPTDSGKNKTDNNGSSAATDDNENGKAAENKTIEVSGDNGTDNVKVDETVIRTTEENEDGSVTVREEIKKEDGSISVKEETKTADGVVTVKEENKRINGTGSSETVIMDADNNVISSTKETTTITNKGTLETVSTTENEDGSKSESSVKTSKSGNKVVTESLDTAPDGSTVKLKETVVIDDEGYTSISSKVVSKNAEGKTVQTVIYESLSVTDENGNTDTVSDTIIKNGKGKVQSTVERFEHIESDEDGNIIVIAQTNTVYRSGKNDTVLSYIKTDKEGNVLETYTEALTENTDNKTTFAVEANDAGKTIYKLDLSLGSNGNAVVTSFKTKDNDYSIPESVVINGANVKITAIARRAMKKNKKIESITIGENITKIGKQAFYGDKKLKTIRLTASIKKIGEGAFKGIAKDAVFIIKADSDKAFNRVKKLIIKSGVSETVTFERE